MHRKVIRRLDRYSLTGLTFGITIKKYTQFKAKIECAQTGIYCEHIEFNGRLESTINIQNGN